VRALEAVEVHVPVHRLRRGDQRLAGLGLGAADLVGLGLGDQFLADEHLDLLPDGGGILREGGSQVIAHLFAHEHAVRADVHDALLGEESLDQRLDVRVDQWFAAANGNHRSVAFLRGAEAVVQAHNVLEGRRVLANAPAAGAGQVAGVQGLELQDSRELAYPQDLFLDDVCGDLGRERQRKPHRLRITRNNAASVKLRKRPAKETLRALWHLKNQLWV
jgi:hypothetical protein